MPRHLLHGLVVRTPLALAAVAAPVDAVPQVEVRVERAARLDGLGPPPGPVLARVDDEHSGRRHVLTGTRERWCLELLGAARVHGGPADAPVVVHVADHVDDRLLAVLIAGPVITTVSLMRGRPLIHASSVDTPGGVVLVVGPSGIGKSSVARLLVAGGAGSLFSDDSSRAELVEGAPLAFSGTISSRLRSAVLARADGSVRVETSPDGRVVVSEPAASVNWRGRPLRLVLAPLLSTAVHQVGWEPVTGALAAMLVADSEALSGLVDPGLRAEHFRHCAALVAAGVLVGRLAVPWQGGETDSTSLAAAVAEAVRQAASLGEKA